MNIKLRKDYILVSLCAFQLNACALIQEDTQPPMALLSPSVMAMIQQDAQDKVRQTQASGEEEIANPDAISIEQLLQNALGGQGTLPKFDQPNSKAVKIPRPTKKPVINIG